MYRQVLGDGPVGRLVTEVTSSPASDPKDVVDELVLRYRENLLRICKSSLRCYQSCNDTSFRQFAETKVAYQRRQHVHLVLRSLLSKIWPRIVSKRPEETKSLPRSF